jgi:hypothetical protein
VAEEMGMDPLAYSRLPGAEDFENLHLNREGREGLPGVYLLFWSWTRRKERSPKKMTAGRYF